MMQPPLEPKSTPGAECARGLRRPWQRHCPAGFAYFQTRPHRAMAAALAREGHLVAVASVATMLLETGAVGTPGHLVAVASVATMLLETGAVGTPGYLVSVASVATILLETGAVGTPGLEAGD